MELISHRDLARLHPTGGHPESGERVAVLHERFGFHECAPARPEDVLRCHTPALLERVRTTRGWIDADTICTETTYDAAMLAAGAAIEAVARGGFALARPPGHHAEPDRAMGFCLFNSIAVAARFARCELGLRRVAILDWDVHHGNGTQAIVGDDVGVLFVSLHQWPFYPGTGGPHDQSDRVLNIPLSAGTTDERYLDAFERAEQAIAASSQSSLSSRPGSTPTSTTRSASWSYRPRFWRDRSARFGPRAARRRSPRRRIQPRHAAGARRERDRRLQRTAHLRSPHAITAEPAKTRASGHDRLQPSRASRRAGRYYLHEGAPLCSLRGRGRAAAPARRSRNAHTRSGSCGR